MLYQVSATNTEGIEGLVSLSSGKVVATSHPLGENAGFNPEELLALSWATCLNATIQALLEQEYKSIVRVEVGLEQEGNGDGYVFAVYAQAGIAKMEPSQAEALIAKAHQRCPVSKLIHQAKTVHLEVVEYESLLD